MFFFSSIFAQETRSVKLYWKWDEKIYEAEIYNGEKLLRKIKYEISYNSDHVDFYYINYTEFDYSLKQDSFFSFGWNLKKNAFVLELFYKYINEFGEVMESVVINANIESMYSLGSVFSISRRDGLEKKYPPGEYYYDFPADPDSIFNAIPKELGLPDTLLHIKYKQPWME